MSSKEIVTKTAKINLDFVSIASLKEAYDSILKSKKDSLNLIMGSFYFSAEFLKYIQNKRNLSISLSNLERAIS
jgi:folylpolyglutamate synthase/dihydropteroate synthase